MCKYDFKTIFFQKNNLGVGQPIKENRQGGTKFLMRKILKTYIALDIRMKSMKAARVFPVAIPLFRLQFMDLPFCICLQKFAFILGKILVRINFGYGNFYFL